MTATRPARRTAVLLAATALAAGCGGSGDPDEPRPSPSPGDVAAATASPAPGSPDKASGDAPAGGFDPQAIYRQASPGVVTVISLFGGGGIASVLGGDGGGGGQGSGFVLNEEGEIVTNAHVVTTDGGETLKAADQVYVSFADGNRVEADVRGYDPNADVALLKVDPSDLDLQPLPLGSSEDLTVGAPVAAMGSPFGEEQSLSVGIVSAVDRSVESLNADFQIPGAIQTDAAINPGNSGGPLVDARGRVIGINQQIQTRSGGNEGVGFAVPVDLVKRSVDELREEGRAEYAYLGVSTSEIYPQLAERFDLPVNRGAWVQVVPPGGPAARAGLRAGSGREVAFQGGRFRPGGDVVVSVDGTDIADPGDLAEAVALRSPGETIDVIVLRGGDRRTIEVELGKRPLEVQQDSGG